MPTFHPLQKMLIRLVNAPIFLFSVPEKNNSASNIIKARFCKKLYLKTLLNMIRFRNISEVGCGVHSSGSTTLVKIALGLVAVTKKKKEMPGSQLVLLIMVAYQCCGSEMFISYPDFFPIPHPGFRIRIPGSQKALDLGSRTRGNTIAHQGQSCGSRAS